MLLFFYFRVFSRPSQVYWHVHKEHVNIYGNSSEKMTCKWGGPEGRGPGCLSSRPKLSLLTHINVSLSIHLIHLDKRLNSFLFHLIGFSLQCCCPAAISYSSRVRS